MQKACEAVLLKTVELASGQRCLYPRMTYCYLGLRVSLERLLLRPDFYKHSELWRYQEKHENMMEDMYDGEMWANFQSYK